MAEVMLTIFLGFMTVLSVITLFVIFTSLFGFYRTNVPFYPTPVAELRSIVDLCQINSHSRIVDLGSGDGRVLLHLEKLTGSKNLLGYEQVLWLFIYSAIVSRFKRSRARFTNKSFWTQSLINSDFIYAYLYPPLMKRLAEKLKTELRPGTIIVSRDYFLPGWTPIEIIRPNKQHEYYIYRT